MVELTLFLLVCASKQATLHHFIVFLACTFCGGCLTYSLVTGQHILALSYFHVVVDRIWLDFLLPFVGLAQWLVGRSEGNVLGRTEEGVARGGETWRTVHPVLKGKMWTLNSDDDLSVGPAHVFTPVILSPRNGELVLFLHVMYASYT